MSTLVVAERLFEIIDARTLEILERRKEIGAVRRRGWLVRRALLAADLAGLSLAFVAAQEIYGTQTHGPGALSRGTEFLGFAISLPFWIVATKLYGLYDRDEERADHSTGDDVSGVFHLVTVCTFLLYAASHLTRWFRPEFLKLFLFWLLAILGTVTLRAAARAYCRRQIHYLQNTIVVGAGDVGQTIARKLLQHHEYGINLVGFVDAEPKERAEDLDHLTVLGELSELDQIVSLLDVERVIVAFSNESSGDVLEGIRALRRQGVQVDIVPRLFDSLGPSVAMHTVEGIPLVSLPPNTLSTSSVWIKRGLDVVLSAAALLVLSPVILVLLALTRFDSRGPGFYRHERVGRYRKPFGLFKIRTMRMEYCRGERYGGDAAEAEFARLMSDPLRRNEFAKSYKLVDDPRVTRVGAFLRRTSLDELPQLVNVLRGDISLVGPRPLTNDEIDQYYGDAASDLLTIRPGVTGYWQINGRSDLEYDDRVRLDMAYVGGWTLGLDFQILARTARVIFSKRGAV